MNNQQKQQKLAQLQKTEQRLWLTVKVLSGTIAMLMIGSCVSQPTVKPNQGQAKTTQAKPAQSPTNQGGALSVPTPTTNQNNYTIVNTGQMRPTQPQYQPHTPQHGQTAPSTPKHQPVEVPRQEIVGTAPQQPSVSPRPTRQYTSFTEWQNDFLQRTGGAGQLVANAHLNSRAISLDNNQAEFTSMVWNYLDNRTTATMVSQGRENRRANLSILDRNEAQYGVPASIVTAIWGIETGYGKNMGNMDLVDSLSSLAYDGRRRAWAESQLLAMNQMLAQGDVSESQFKGSYAGGMGHTQFIPTTWLAQGVDGNNDGRKNPFAVADALTSTASYLANAGWVRHLPAYIEVGLPQGFNYGYIGQKLPLDQWQALGLVGFSDSIAGGAVAELWLPAGINGPALLITQNFDVIKVYNNSSNYALAVAVLAQKLNGKAGIEKEFPRHEKPLSKTQIQALQRNLTAMGYDTGGADGIAGANTRRAFARWQSANGRIPDGFITQNSAGQLAY